jgi:Sulfotransferase family
MTLPNFLVIGAAKSGTTSLYEYLKQHPQVYMSPLKETNFFAFDGARPGFGGPDGDVFNRDSVYRPDEYRRLFERRTDEIAVGEVSPRYLGADGAALRIKRCIPDAKLIAILRNPADRAFSAFSMRKRDGWEPCATLDEAIADEPRRIEERWGSGIYLRHGFYAELLQPYFEHFGRDQIRIYLYDDFLAAPEGLFEDLFGFLGVDRRFCPITSQQFNVSGVIKNPVMRLIWTRSHSLQKGIRPFLPKTARQRISGFFIGLEKERLPFPPDQRSRLIDRYRADIQQLQDLIGRDLSAWLIASEHDSGR